MGTLHTFKPTLDGPASMKATTCSLPSSVEDPQVTDDDDGVAATQRGDVAATEHKSTSHLDLPAEFLIGIHENDVHDPIDLMIVFQKNLELVQEAGKRIYKLEQQRVHSAGTEEAAFAAITLAAEKTKHTAALVELRKQANKMGKEYQQQMTDALAAFRIKGATANTPRTLHVRSGKPVNMLSHQRGQRLSWSSMGTALRI